MSNKVKYIDIKICTYYFFNHTVTIINFDPNSTRTDEDSYKNILIFNTLDM